jgi:hypothetical protein
MWLVKTSGIIAVICVVLAVSAVWLVLSDPVSVATAVQTGDFSGVYALLSHTLLDLLRSVLRWL